MATANITSEFLDLLNRISASSDPLTDVLGISLGSGDALTTLLSAEFEEPVVSIANSSLLSVALRTTEGNAYTLALTGTGMGPLVTLDAFIEAITNGTATGVLNGLSFSNSTTELVAFDLSTTAMSISLEDTTISLVGSFPNELASLPAVLQVMSLLDVEALAALTAEEGNALAASLSDISLTDLTVTSGGVEVMSLDVSSTGLVLSLPGYTAELGGTVPTNLGDFATVFLAGLDASGDAITGLLTALDITSLDILNADGDEIAVLDGALAALDDLVLTINGVALPEGASIQFDLAGTDVNLTATDANSVLIGTAGVDALNGGLGDDVIFALAGNDSVNGSGGDDIVYGDLGNDRLSGDLGNDTINGGDGSDTLIGGLGDDFLYGGATEADLRDILYGGDGNDSLDGGYGNDELRGDAGNDTITGGFGVDTIIGGTGNDVLTGQAWSDLIFGGDGDDFINGGFGFDRLNGGAGADKFFHIGIRDHGSDWIQDYSAADGDILQFGGASNTSISDFLIQRATTLTAGDAGMQEVFVTQISTGNLLWALVDGDAQEQINIQIGGQVFDLLA